LVGRLVGRLERMRDRGLLHAVGRIELVHAAPDVDELRIRRRSAERERGKEGEKRGEERQDLQAACSFFAEWRFGAEAERFLRIRPQSSYCAARASRSTFSSHTAVCTITTFVAGST